MKSLTLIFSACLVAGVAARTMSRSSPTEYDDREEVLRLQMEEWTRQGKPDPMQFPDEEGNAFWVNMTSLHAESKSVFRANYEKDISFYICTRDNMECTAVQRDREQVLKAGWRPNRPTKFLIHGFTNNIRSRMMATLKNGFLTQGDYNVVGVDWGKLCPKPLYITSRSHVEGVGKQVAKMIEFLIAEGLMKCEDAHVIGHSLGAHVAGMAGKSLGSCKLPRITGMDPALPLFILITKDRLSSSDAKVVDVIHTCAGWLGFDISLGTVDYYPNGGRHPQPGCGVDFVGSCSHARSFELFAESIIEPETFKATLCQSDEAALKQKCDDSDVVSLMGLRLRFKVSGPYYLETAPSYPYSDMQQSGQV